jgi:hypothetical protein
VERLCRDDDVKVGCRIDIFKRRLMHGHAVREVLGLQSLAEHSKHVRRRLYNVDERPTACERQGRPAGAGADLQDASGRSTCRSQVQIIEQALWELRPEPLVIGGSPRE